MKSGPGSEELIDLTISDEEINLLDPDDFTHLIENLSFDLAQDVAKSPYINPDFVLFGERASYDSIAACAPISLVPGLAEVMVSSSPPDLDFFMNTPRIPHEKHWGVYLLVTKQKGYLPGVYVGSGTNQDYGAEQRMRNYKPDSSSLPKLVAKAFRNGYHLVHIGLLCWTDLPTFALVPQVRARMKAFEAAFTVAFNAYIPMNSDKYLKDLILWPRTGASICGCLYAPIAH